MVPSTGGVPSPGRELREALRRIARLPRNCVGANTVAMKDSTLDAITALRDLGAVEIEFTNGTVRRVRFPEPPAFEASPVPGDWVDGGTTKHLTLDDIIPDERSDFEKQRDYERLMYHSSGAGPR